MDWKQLLVSITRSVDRELRLRNEYLASENRILRNQISDQTVGNILKRHSIPPAPERKKTVTWREFIRIHMDVLGATDFFNSDRSDNDLTSPLKGNPVTKGGVTGGAGLAFPIGGASLFVESRYTNVYTQGEDTRWVPIVLGLKWR